MQLLSATSDGLISVYSCESCSLFGRWKLWRNVEEVDSRSIRAINVLDRENGRYLICSTLGLYFVRDETKQIQAECLARRSEVLVRQQLIDNLLKQPNKEVEALNVCLQGDHSWAALNILERMSHERIKATVGNLSLDQCRRLCEWMVNWCCFAGHRGFTGQLILNCILTSLHPDDVSMCISPQHIHALLAYCKRRKTQLKNLQCNAKFIAIIADQASLI